MSNFHIKFIFLLNSLVYTFIKIPSTFDYSRSNCTRSVVSCIIKKKRREETLK